MAAAKGSEGQRVVVVTGGAAGIGAAIAEELGRQGAFVVTMDPVVSLDGSSRLELVERTTADRIVEAGGSARASNTSVTDAEAVDELLRGLVAEFGRLDAVVNVAGISRPTEFGSGTEEDWVAVLSVHLHGYLNVLRSALPIMVAAQHGTVLGVTSGSGWRPANTGAYGCAKRAVAALTWQVGRHLPPGVTVNALSPIAATRMVTAGRAVAPVAAGAPPDQSRTGGLSLMAMPAPESLGPIGAYLASEQFGWSSGRIIFSGGSEVAPIAEPGFLEVIRTDSVTSLPHLLASALPSAFIPAELTQGTNGGTNPRFAQAFVEDGLRVASTLGRCLVVTDRAEWAASLSAALEAGGVECVGVGAGDFGHHHGTEVPDGFAAASELVSAVAAQVGAIDAVVVALEHPATAAAAPSWQTVVAEHAGLPECIRLDAAWARAVADYSAAAERPVRLVTLTDAGSAGGKSRAQASAQLSRAAHQATAGRVDAFGISVESHAAADRSVAAELAAYLLGAPGAGELSGAELAVGHRWLALSSHPKPAGSISFGGPQVPSWLDGALRRMIEG